MSAAPPSSGETSQTGSASQTPQILPTAQARSAAVPLLISAAALVALFVFGVAMGPSDVHVSPGQVTAVILQHVPGLRAIPHAPPSVEADEIVWSLRLPRAAAAALIGALLAYAGVALQGLLMNPLADPYTVGVSSGAAVGATAAELRHLSARLYGFAGAGIAFVTAMAAVALVYAVSRVRGRVSVTSFLLAGVIVGTFLWSLIPLFVVLSGRGDQLSLVLLRLIGSVEGADWLRVGMLVPFLVGLVICLTLWSRELNLMTLGEESAAHLGVEIESLKRRVLLAASLATAAAVTVGGIIAFVGLIVPHLARRIVGPDHRTLAPLAGLFGALLLLAADTVARVALGDQMPVGVLTSLIGAPFFCYLLRRRNAPAW